MILTRLALLGSLLVGASLATQPPQPTPPKNPNQLADGVTFSTDRTGAIGYLKVDDKKKLSPIDILELRAKPFANTGNYLEALLQKPTAVPKYSKKYEDLWDKPWSLNKERAQYVVEIWGHCSLIKKLCHEENGIFLDIINSTAERCYETINHGVLRDHAKNMKDLAKLIRKAKDSTHVIKWIAKELETRAKVLPKGDYVRYKSSDIAKIIGEVDKKLTEGELNRLIEEGKKEPLPTDAGLMSPPGTESGTGPESSSSITKSTGSELSPTTGLTTPSNKPGSESSSSSLSSTTTTTTTPTPTDSDTGLATWQWVLIIIAIIAVLVAIAVVVYKFCLNNDAEAEDVEVGNRP